MVHGRSVQQGQDNVHWIQCDLITPFLLVIIFKWQVIPKGRRSQPLM